jgi:hypothetical protein
MWNACSRSGTLLQCVISKAMPRVTEVKDLGDPTVHPNYEELDAAPLEGFAVLACTDASGHVNHTQLQQNSGDAATTMPVHSRTAHRHERRNRVRLRQPL